jgi:hypothetical protein
MIIFEVGVGPIWSCRSKPYWNKDECVLFEPVYYEEIKKAIAKYPNVQLYDIVIYDYTGQCNFIENGQLSCIQGLNSPHIQFNSQSGIVKSYNCTKLSDFDKGNIDLLLLDMEGAEWFALKHLISRPKKIITEMQTNGYCNPFLNEIQQWMYDNHYKEIDHKGADVVWEK